MATLELDPLFVKALKLLHSKNKDSADQLKQLLDDVISQRRGDSTKKESKEAEKAAARHASKAEEEKKREAEKRTFEKVKQDLSELTSQSGKKPRLETSKDVKDEKKAKEKEKAREREKEREKEKERERKEKEAREKERKEAERRELEKMVKTEVKQEVTVISSDSDEERSRDADDFAFDLGIACIVCRSFDVSSTNKLVECQECHKLYHQECHRPPVTEQDVNDPRFVWYCSRCAKTLKKMVAVKPSKPKLPTAGSSRETGNNGKPSKSEAQALFPFRRTEPLKSSSSRDSASSAAKPLSGLASLAANLSGKGSSESGKSKTDPRHAAAKSEQSKFTGVKSEAMASRPASSSSSGKFDPAERSSGLSQGSKVKPPAAGLHKQGSSGGAASVINADKRLQMMKKKAAANKLKSSSK